MAKNNQPTVTYQIIAPEQKHWNGSDGRWEPVPPYTSIAPIWGTAIREGKGQTTNPQVALDFMESGYTVTPDPHQAVQDLAIEEMAQKVAKGKAEESDLTQLQDFADEWRAQHA